MPRVAGTKSFLGAGSFFFQFSAERRFVLQRASHQVSFQRNLKSPVSGQDLKGTCHFSHQNQHTQELSRGFSEKHALGSWKPGDDGSKSSDVKSFADGNSDVSIGNSSPEKTLGAQNFRVLFRTQWSWPTLGSVLYFRVDP